MKPITLRLATSIMVTALAAISFEVRGHEPVAEEEVAQFEEDGTFNERRDRIESLQPHRMAEGTRERAMYKVQRASLEATGMSPIDAARALTSGPTMAFPYSSAAELPSTGTNKTLTILIDFDDYRATTTLPNLTVEGVRSSIYGDGDSVFRPFESARAYYRRASQGLFELEGTVLGWHGFAKKRSQYEPKRAAANLPAAQRKQQQSLNDNRALFTLISEALRANDATHDFAQYDNDHDDDIDLVTVMYAGPDTGWGSFWWAYRWQLYVPEAATTTFDGKRVRQFVFQFVSTRANGSGFDPTTLIHEMGHSLGLADYYDYDESIGPSGGVGGLDIMDANQGNHNGFSRWLLDWIRPIVVEYGTPATMSLSASGSTSNGAKALAIFPDLSASNAPSQEMFIVENRFKVGNDEQLPGNGLLIWHVDATANENGTDFAHDNSYSVPKLIRLVRADSTNDFGSSERAGPGTFFGSGGAFTPNSTPSSVDYANRDTGILIDQVGPPGVDVTIRVGFAEKPDESEPAISLAAPGAMESAVATNASVDEILAGNEPINLDALEALDRKYTRYTGTELASEWARLNDGEVTLANAETRSSVLTLLLSRWAAKDGRQAAEAVLELPETDALREEALPFVLESWTNHVPADAALWYLDDARKSLRSESNEEKALFTHRAFEGLYVSDAGSALAGIAKLSSTAEIMTAVEAIVRASGELGEDRRAINKRLLKSTSEVARAQTELLEAQRAAQERIKDAKSRDEFREVLERHRDD